MKRSAAETLRSLENRVARLERKATSNIDMKTIKKYFGDIGDIRHHDEDNRSTFLSPRAVTEALREILEIAQKCIVNGTLDKDEFIESVMDEIGDNFFNTRGYGPDHSAQDELYSLVEDFVDDADTIISRTASRSKYVRSIPQPPRNTTSVEKLARSYQPSEQEAIEESLQLTAYNGWVVLTGPERPSYLSDVWSMYTTTYKKIGITVKDPKVLVGKYKVWYVHFDDGVPVAFNLFKKTSFGMKSALSGNDGSSLGRSVSKSWIKTRWKSVNGFYGEVSGAVEHISIKGGAPVVCAAHVPKVLGKPTNGYADDNVHYIRDFGGHKHTKAMIGNPRGIDALPFQKALVQCPIPNESVRLARHEKTSALEDRLASDCSVYENSLFLK